jgi:hypothetical protein
MPLLVACCSRWTQQSYCSGSFSSSSSSRVLQPLSRPTCSWARTWLSTASDVSFHQPFYGFLRAELKRLKAQGGASSRVHHHRLLLCHQMVTCCAKFMGACVPGCKKAPAPCHRGKRQNRPSPVVQVPSSASASSTTMLALAVDVLSMRVPSSTRLQPGD